MAKKRKKEKRKQRRKGEKTAAENWEEFSPEGMVVDHKDGQTLDNRPCNLRVCTPAQNVCNQAPHGKRSRFKGVYPDGDKWCAMIQHKGVTYYLGTFDEEVEAAKARDRKAYELEGEFAYLNFPEDFPPRAAPADAGSAERTKERAAKSERRRKKGR